MYKFIRKPGEPKIQEHDNKTTRNIIVGLTQHELRICTAFFRLLNEYYTEQIDPKNSPEQNWSVPVMDNPFTIASPGEDYGSRYYYLEDLKDHIRHELLMQDCKFDLADYCEKNNINDSRVQRILEREVKQYWDELKYTTNSTED